MQKDYNWRLNRLGKFTGSEIYKLCGAKGLGETGMTYIYEKVSEELTGEEASKFSGNAYTEWGNENEPFAKQYFEKAKNVEIKNIDFYTLDGFEKHVGASPDGIISDEYGIEIKCPANPANHVKYLTIKCANDLKKIKKEYYWQICLNILCSGLEYWKFVSFDPRFTGKLRMYVVDIRPDKKDLEFLIERIKLAVETKTDILNKIKNL